MLSMSKQLHCLALASMLALPAPAVSSLQVRTLAQEGYTGKFNLADHDRPGMMVEIMHAIERIDPSLQFAGLDQQAGLSRIEAELDNGHIDVFFGMAKTDRRAERFIFLNPPLYQASYRLAIRRDDPISVGTLDDVKKLGHNGTILSNADITDINFLKSKGVRFDATGSNTAINLKKLLAGRGRFYYGSTLSIGSEIRHLKLEGEIKLLPLSLQQTNIYAVISKDAPPVMIQHLETALGALDKSGELHRIHTSYLVGF